MSCDSIRRRETQKQSVDEHPEPWDLNRQNQKGEDLGGVQAQQPRRRFDSAVDVNKMGREEWLP